MLAPPPVSAPVAARAAFFAARWQLALGPAFPRSVNAVFAATAADGRAVVLKLGADPAAIRREAAVLAHYAGHGAAPLLAADPAHGALLLARVLPGTPLAALADNSAATAVAARAMQSLWRPAPPGLALPAVADWLGGLRAAADHAAAHGGPLPLVLIVAAQGRAAELLATAAPPVVLHGDLHHYNILQAASAARWLVIDPQGVLGEPAYETGALLRNPLALPHWPDCAAITARRIRQLAAILRLDPARIHGWAWTQAVLSAWWSVEDRAAGAAELGPPRRTDPRPPAVAQACKNRRPSAPGSLRAACG